MLKLLIVDDTKSVHMFIKGLLQNTKNIEFSDAYNGQEALEILKSGKVFDLILLDWEMPILNGPQAFDEFKKIGNKIPVIMTTTKNAPSEIEQMLIAGVAEYMMKPFTKDILIEKIKSVSGMEISDGK